jgi:tripartite-type tricarboxylate transporter receptor subunit TctC
MTPQGWCRLACLGLAFVASEARAQEENFPNRPVRIVSDSAPGSAIDTALRIIVDGLTQRWGQQVLVLNHPGASGALAVRVASDARPDGYTLFAPALSVFLALPGKAPGLPLELPRDFLPVGFTAEQPMSIGVAPPLGVTTLRELIALAKQQPGKLSYAASGIGRLTHLTGELLQIRANISLQMVPYAASGSAHALSDILAGRIPIVIEGYSGLAGAYESGALKALAIASAQREPNLPDLPTVAETLPGFTATGWQVVLAPHGTPEAIINKVSADLRAVESDPDRRDKLAARGSYLRPMSPAEVLAFVREQQTLWRPALERIADTMK